MAGVVQWTIDQFWSELQRIENAAKQIRADLKADQAQLTRLWHQSTLDPNRVRAADDQRLLRPLIHQNSVLRLSYLKPVTDKFNQAISIAGSVLKKAGYSTPALSGLGFAVVIAPATAVVLVLGALALVGTAVVLTAAQRRHTAAVARLMADTHATPEQKKLLLDAMDKENKSAKGATSLFGFDFGQLIPLAAIIAGAMIIPQLLRQFGSRRAAA